MSKCSEESGEGFLLPKLIVFDIDCTLWPFWVDTHVDPPFRKSSDGTICDAHGYKINLYPEVMDVLHWLKERHVEMAVASRTQDPPAGKELLKMMNIDKFFNYQEIYPGRKVAHFNKFTKDSGIPFSQMLFFDDEERNIVDITKLGVTCVFVPNGMTMDLLKEGLVLYKQRSKTSR